MAQRNQIVMVKRQNPKRVTLPNARAFYARYKRTTRAELPANVRLQRPYRKGLLHAVDVERKCRVEEVSKVHLKKF